MPPMRIAGGFDSTTRTPGMRESFGRSSSMISSAVFVRSSRGFRSTFRRPPPGPPTFDVNAATFSSFSRTAMTSF